MNTRVQVEHCVTEAVTGVDIVREQILIAAGEPISFGQDDIRWHGHAIECRINAEDAAKNFAPAPGTIAHYREPSGPGVRVDSGVLAGSEITPLYDPMVAKLIVWDADREQATRRMARALDEFEIEGVKTLIPFHKAIMASEQWAQRRDLPRPDRGPRSGSRSSRSPKAPRARGRRRPETVERDYIGRGLRQALRGQGARRGVAAARNGAGADRAPARSRERERKSGGGAAAAATRWPRRCRATSSRSLVEKGADGRGGRPDVRSSRR